jgi:hypothetical protein
MKQGTGQTLFWVLCWAGFCQLGCGSSNASPSPATTCGTIDAPHVVTLTNLQPALGSSVLDANIVHSFTILGFEQIEPDLGEALPQHTAGDRSLSPMTWTVTTDANGDFSYASTPITWPIAPGHVELDAVPFVAKGTHCTSKLPSPTFSYDVTLP